MRGQKISFYLKTNAIFGISASNCTRKQVAVIQIREKLQKGSPYSAVSTQGTTQEEVTGVSRPSGDRETAVNCDDL